MMNSAAKLILNQVSWIEMIENLNLKVDFERFENYNFKMDFERLNLIIKILYFPSSIMVT